MVIVFLKQCELRPQHLITTACPLHQFSPLSRYMALVPMATIAQYIQRLVTSTSVGWEKQVAFLLPLHEKKNVDNDSKTAFRALYL